MASSSIDNPTREEPADSGAAVVVPLNDAATTFTTLAGEIRGAAAGWSEQAVQELEARLLDAYGPLLGGERAVKQLIALAMEPTAA